MLVLAYLGVLLLVGWRADHRSPTMVNPRRRALTHSLSIAALCTAWTYFGAVSLASSDGWAYLGYFLGPLLSITVLFPLWQRIAVASKRENVASIADFLSSRYGKSRPLGTLVACVAMIGVLPYMALQLSMLSLAWSTITGEPSAGITPLIATVLAGFAILLGARRPSLTQHNRGLLQVVALESILKITGLLALAGLAVMLIFRAGPGALSATPFSNPPPLGLGFFVATVLSMMTDFVTPRQFHINFVALEDVNDLKTARWVFPLYLVVWALAVLPIAAAVGIAGPQLGLNPDMLVLGLPMQHAGVTLSALVFLGGFSAGAAMVMVEIIALSSMISNELVLPVLARTRWRVDSTMDVSKAIVRTRQLIIVLVLLLAWGYFMASDPEARIGRLGTTSSVALAQLLPALIGAVLWRRGTARGAFCGIAVGMTVWLYLIALPQLPMVEGTWLAAGTFSPFSGNGRLLFNGGLVLSLSLNLACYIGISLFTRLRLVEVIQANAFIAPISAGVGSTARALGGTVGHLRLLVEQFLGREDARRAFDEFRHASGRPLRDSDQVDPAVARAAERMLTGAIGASSGRNVIALALAGNDRRPSDIGDILDEAAHAVQFSRDLLQTTIDNLNHGVTVVDAELRLVAWNARFLDLFGFQPADIYVGKPLEEVVRDRLEAIGLATDEVRRRITRQLQPIRDRVAHNIEVEWRPGIIIKVTGAPVGSGEYVTSFSDISEIRAAAEALRQSNEALESRVRDRTRELIAVNAALIEANAVAESASQSQARFIASASHDLLQPMHAARLFIGAAADTLPAGIPARDLVRKADQSIDAADRLLRALLNLSRLEAGGGPPEFSRVDCRTLLETLRREFAPLAAAKGVRLRVAATTAWVLSDQDLLRSVLQNLISNAVRYTAQGAILIGCRRDRAGIRIEVRDSGPGIAEEALPLIFKEFSRLPSGAAASPGAGLGLSIVERICRALGHRLDVRSAIGRGSTFSVVVPAARDGATAGEDAITPGLSPALRVLCVENEPSILQALEALLGGWGIHIDTASSGEAALTRTGRWDAVLADYHLGDGMTGLALLEAMADRADAHVLITANPDEAVIRLAEERGVVALRKPVSPDRLRALLASLQDRRRRRPVPYPDNAGSESAPAYDC